MLSIPPLPEPASAALLTVNGLWKSYSAVVLSDVDFDLRAGEVHALVGENGAGKSTLVRIIAGLTKPDRGEMRLRGQSFAPDEKTDAETAGIRIVLQELNLIGNLTVAENIFLEDMPHRLGWIDYARMNAEARRIMAQVGLEDIDPARPVNTLGVGHQQLVEIASGFSHHCEVLILDEPTAALTDPEIELLFVQIARLKAQGVGVIYISHRLEEIQRIADRITVLRDGKIAGTRPAREMSTEQMVRLMVGRELGDAIHRPKKTGGKVALRVRGLRRSPAVEEVSFEVRRGEILGFAGLMGSGRTETMRAIFGADRPEAGEVYIGDSDRPVVIRSPRDAVRNGIALLTEDRKEQGLLLSMPVRVNITLMCLRGLSRWGGWIGRAAESAEAEKWAKALGVRAASVEQLVGQLSGGNQQKVVIAKWLFRNCDILIFDEPTRGIDIGAKFEIYQLLADLAGQGKALIVVSSDLKELLALCDRAVVMSAGRVAATFERSEWTQDKIMAAALSGYLEE